MSSINAQFRYQIIDHRLRTCDINQWEDLAEACCLAAEENLINDTRPSKRTIMYDIQRMRSGVLGYEAPINYSKEKGYYYSVRGFSIFNVTLSKTNVEKLRDALLILKQLTKNQNLLDLHGIVTILEDKLNLKLDMSSKPVICLEHSLNEAGQKWLDTVYRYIKKKQAIRISYAPFDGPEAEHIISPAFIQEYNNRWYVFGYSAEMGRIINLALDRVKGMSPTLRQYETISDMKRDEWFRSLYGVTTPDDAKVERIVFRTSMILGKYIASKPIHTSQAIMDSTDEWMTFSLDVYINYEIIHRLIGFGADLEVLMPATLVEIMKNKTAAMSGFYHDKSGN